MIMKSVLKGRPRSLPPEAFGTVQRLRSEGLGFRRIADALMAQGIDCSKSSVERFWKSQGAYQGKQVPSDEHDSRVV